MSARGCYFAADICTLQGASMKSMLRRFGAARGAAAAIALVAWVGLAVQFDASLALSGSAGAALWAMLRYFTVIANILLASVFTGLALGRSGSKTALLLGGATLAIVLVGVVYGLLLRGLVELSGGARIADLLLHHVTPVLAPLFWLAYAPRGALRRRDPLIWALCPLAYFVYAMARGAIEGVYAYPFMDVGKIGWAQTGLIAVIIALCFLAAGYGLLWLDGRLARRVGGGDP